ncbi:MAG: hypothetical protein ABI460_06765 [Caldimonas sp.]
MNRGAGGKVILANFAPEWLRAVLAELDLSESPNGSVCVFGTELRMRAEATHSVRVRGFVDGCCAGTAVCIVDFGGFSPRGSVGIHRRRGPKSLTSEIRS